MCDFDEALRNVRNSDSLENAVIRCSHIGFSPHHNCSFRPATATKHPTVALFSLDPRFRWFDNVVARAVDASVPAALAVSLENTDGPHHDHITIDRRWGS